MRAALMHGRSPRTSKPRQLCMVPAQLSPFAASSFPYGTFGNPLRWFGRLNPNLGEPMSIWAAVVTLVMAVAAYLAGDPMTLLSGVAELAVVLALFALVCAAEAWN